MLERDSSAFRNAGQLRVLDHGLPVEIHGQTLAFHRNDETIPLADRFIRFPFRCDASAHLRRLIGIEPIAPDFAGSDWPTQMFTWLWPLPRK
jgi:hypothetical protein